MATFMHWLEVISLVLLIFPGCIAIRNSMKGAKLVSLLNKIKAAADSADELKIKLGKIQKLLEEAPKKF
jgi:hypothetical protein